MGGFIGHLLLILLLGIFPRYSHAECPKTNQSIKPNIVTLMVDDLDTKTLQTLLDNGYMNQFKEHILSRGVNFNNSYVTNSLCCPSRTTFLTGQYTKNHGVLSVNHTEKKINANGSSQNRGGIKYLLDQANDPKKAEKNNLFSWLQKAGYFTGLIGKYLNGYGSETSKTYVPDGFSYWRGLTDPDVYNMYGFSVCEKGKFTNPKSNISVSFSNTKVTHNSSYAAEIEENYQTDVLTREAVEFIEGHANLMELQKKQEPFALLLTPAAPHTEKKYKTGKTSGKFAKSIRHAKRYDYLFDGNAANGELPYPELSQSVDERTLDADGVNDKPQSVKNASSLSLADKNSLKQQYKDRMGALLSVDDMIGELVAKLKEKCLYDNTTIIFTSDNGWLYGEHGLGGKSVAYEESIKVPLVIASPHHTKGGISDQLVGNHDLAPTIVQMAGAQPERIMDGTSLLPQLHNPAAPNGRKLLFIENYVAGTKDSEEDSTGETHPNTFAAIRYKDYTNNFLYVHDFLSSDKLEGHSSFSELYDLNNDPLQLSNFIPPINQKIDLDMMIQDFAHKSEGQYSQLSTAPSPKQLEKESLPGTEYKQFSGCVFYYNYCKQQNFIQGTLGEYLVNSKSHKYKVAFSLSSEDFKKLNEESLKAYKEACWTQLYEEAKKCGASKEESDLIAHFYVDNSAVDLKTAAQVFDDNSEQDHSKEKLNAPEESVEAVPKKEEKTTHSRNFIVYSPHPYREDLRSYNLEDLHLEVEKVESPEPIKNGNKEEFVVRAQAPDVEIKLSHPMGLEEAQAKMTDVSHELSALAQSNSGKISLIEEEEFMNMSRKKSVVHKKDTYGIDEIKIKSKGLSIILDLPRNKKIFYLFDSEKERMQMYSLMLSQFIEACENDWRLFLQKENLKPYRYSPDFYTGKFSFIMDKSESIESTKKASFEVSSAFLKLKLRDEKTGLQHSEWTLNPLNKEVLLKEKILESCRMKVAPKIEWSPNKKWIWIEPEKNHK